jgi:predicted dehydrogenase
VDAVEEAGVASIVFFTDRFVPRIRDWLAGVDAAAGWQGGWMRWFSALQEPDNPFGASVWRHERGALWDTGPHALSTLSAALGPVASVTAVAGAGDLVNLVFHHVSGVTSTATLTQFAPPAAVTCETVLWGEDGFSSMPPRPEGDFGSIVATAAEELVSMAHTGDPHPLDVRFGARVVELLAEAQSQIGS